MKRRCEHWCRCRQCCDAMYQELLDALPERLRSEIQEELLSQLQDEEPTIIVIPFALSK